MNEHSETDNAEVRAVVAARMEKNLSRMNEACWERGTGPLLKWNVTNGGWAFNRPSRPDYRKVLDSVALMLGQEGHY